MVWYMKVEVRRERGGGGRKKQVETQRRREKNKHRKRGVYTRMQTVVKLTMIKVKLEYYHRETQIRNTVKQGNEICLTVNAF